MPSGQLANEHNLLVGSLHHGLTIHIMFRVVRAAAVRSPWGSSSSSSSRACYSSTAKPRHLMSINDLTPTEFTTLVRNAAASKAAVAKNDKLGALGSSLTGKTIAMMFSKLSTRTRVSSEGAVALMGGHPMFLGKNDIQLGVRTEHSQALRGKEITIISTTD